MALTTRSDLYRRALELIPGGVNSPVRAMRAVGLDEPFFVARGEGASLDDVDGNRYLDWVLSWGPLIFGHADPERVEAVREAALRGNELRRADRGEVELAAEIADAVPSVEKVRLVSSGTEAAMSAMRLARGFTKRDRVIKFAGCYHGHADALLARPGPGSRRSASRRRRACRPRVTADTIVCPYNEIDAVAEAVAALRRGTRRDHRRAGRREHGRRPAAPTASSRRCGALRRLGRAARLRRGDHRLPRRARRRAGALRRHART